METLGGALLEDELANDLSAGALESTLAVIASLPSAPIPLPDAVEPLPTQVHDIVASAIGKAAWQTASPGFKILDLDLPPTAAGETFQLFRIEPGAGPPRHTHEGQEFTLVLTGAFKDETGVYRPGDIEYGDEAITHRPVAEPGEVCFALAVTTAPLKFKGPLGVLQRVMNLGRK
jgi:putative transcriptional regulator